MPLKQFPSSWRSFSLLICATPLRSTAEGELSSSHLRASLNRCGCDPLPKKPKNKGGAHDFSHMQITLRRVCVQVVSTGGGGVLILAQREYSTLTYRSLQPGNDFADRGVEQLPKYFYREHSLMVWEAIHKYRTHTRQNVLRNYGTAVISAWGMDKRCLCI